MMRLLLVILSLLFSVPAFAVCSDASHEESLITANVSPQDKVWIFEADGLKTFIKSMQEAGFLIGNLPFQADRIFVTSDGSDDKPTLTMFFLQDHCIIYVQAVNRAAMMTILPQ